MAIKAICRDCLWTGDRKVERCPACGSRRMVCHDELDQLTIAHLDCDAFYASGRFADVFASVKRAPDALAETLRELILGTPMQPDTETLLVFAARAEHLAPGIKYGVSLSVSRRIRQQRRAAQAIGMVVSTARCALMDQRVV